MQNNKKKLSGLFVLSIIFVLVICCGCLGWQKSSAITNDGIAILSQGKSIININGDINLSGKKVLLRDSVKIVVKNGKIYNGTLTGRGVRIEASKKQIFEDCNFEGEWNVDRAYPEWFGAINDGTKDCTKAIQSMFDFMEETGTYKCKFSPCDYNNGKFYLISKTIYIRRPVKIEGGKAFVSSRKVIPYKDDPKHKSYLTDGIAFHFIGKKNMSTELTDICLNIKVHAKPFFFSQLSNAYIHDCYISTFSGDKEATNGVYTFWFGFQCDELSHAKFENLHIDQPSNNTYNSSDGIHLSGGCHDIMIENCYGQAGDDFIALNANENHSGDIYNVHIKKCKIGKVTPSVSGIRMYGCSRLSHAPGKPQLKISNVTVEDCYIRTTLSPCIFFANNPDWQRNDTTSLKLFAKDIDIKNCALQSQMLRDNRISIWIGGAECENVTIDGVTTIDDEQDGVSLIGLQGFNELNRMSMRNSGQGKKPAKMSIKNETTPLGVNIKGKGRIQMNTGIMEFAHKKGEQFAITDGVLVEK